MNYESWRITFQSSDQAARAAHAQIVNMTAQIETLQAEIQMLRATVVDSVARDVIAWCYKNPPAGDALYCIARLRQALATASANDQIQRRR